MIVPQVQKIGPEESEPTPPPPAGARHMRKATVKIRRNPSPGFIGLDPEDIL